MDDLLERGTDMLRLIAETHPLAVVLEGEKPWSALSQGDLVVVNTRCK